MSDVSTINHSLMCECGHVSGGHYYNPSLSGFDRCINCECKQFRLSCFEPTQTSPERAELQVSLLNEIGLTLTAVAERLKPIERIDTIEGMILDLAQRLYGRLEGIETTLIKEFINAKKSRDSDYALDDRRWEVMHDRVQAIESQLVALAKERAEQAETLKTYKLSLEGIQGLLVDLDAKVDESAEAGEKRLTAIEELLAGIGVLGAKLDAHDGHLTAIDIVSSEGTQRILKERGERLDRIDAMLERMVTEIDHVAKRYSHVAARLAHIEGRLDNAMGKFIWLDARGEARLATALEAINLRLPERPVTVKRKPSLRPVSRKKRKR